MFKSSDRPVAPYVLDGPYRWDRDRNGFNTGFVVGSLVTSGVISLLLLCLLVVTE